MASPATHTPDQRLWSIVGRWRISGQVIGEPTTPIMGGDVYDVLPRGGNFLGSLVRMDGRGPQGPTLETHRETDGAPNPCLEPRRCGGSGSGAANGPRRWWVPARAARPGRARAGGLGAGQVHPEWFG